MKECWAVVVVGKVKGSPKTNEYNNIIIDHYKSLLSILLQIKWMNKEKKKWTRIILTSSAKKKKIKNNKNIQKNIY